MSIRGVLHLLGFLLVVHTPIGAQQEPVKEEILSGAGRGEAHRVIPREYGKLVSVVESGGVHYLYFQDDDGNVRIFLLGVKGSASRAKVDLEALPHSVYKIPRSEPTSEHK